MHPGMAIRRGLGNEGGGDGAARAGAIVRHHRQAEAPRQDLRLQRARDVGDAARRQEHHEADRPVRPGASSLRDRWSAEQRGGGQGRQQTARNHRVESSDKGNRLGLASKKRTTMENPAILAGRTHGRRAAGPVRLHHRGCQPQDP